MDTPANNAPHEPVAASAEIAGSASDGIHALAIVRGLREENRELRTMCAIAHAGLALYTDDGELQDSREHPWIDWKRDPVALIESNLRERLVRRMRAESEKRGILPNIRNLPADEKSHD